MEKVLKVFSSHEEADEADVEFYRSLTPQERMTILLELIRRRQNESERRIKRVYRIIALEES